MKTKILCSFLFLFSCNSIVAQRPSPLTIAQQIFNNACPSIFRTSSISCSPQVSLTNCNYIRNNQFLTTIPNYNESGAFGNNEVIDWGDSHGSSQLWHPNNVTLSNFPNLPLGVTNYAAMFSSSNFGSFDYHEGIVTKIPPLTIGNKYSISFLERFLNYYPANIAKFNVYLIKCLDYSNFNLTSYTTPIIPIQSQNIYCETNCSTSSNWQRISNTFIANGNYDMIWFFPSEGAPISQIAGYAFIAIPELIDVTNFNLSMSPALPTPGNCTITITPNNCAITGTVYNWVGPNGQTYTGPFIQLDTSNPLLIGTWTATQAISNITSTHSVCGNPFNVSATINVPSCSTPCINLPLVQQ